MKQWVRRGRSEQVLEKEERKGMRDKGTKVWKSREDGLEELNETIGAIFWCPELGTES